MEFCKIATASETFTNYITAKAKALLATITWKKMAKVLPNVCTKLNEIVKTFNIQSKYVCTIKN